MAGLIKRSTITVRSESNIAASLSLLELVIKCTTSSEILLAIMADLSTVYFQPLLDLLSSTKHLFPNGPKARVSLTHSLVELLKRACKRLGTSRSAEVLIDVLKCFFTCYSTAHGIEINANNDLSPVEEHFGKTGEPMVTAPPSNTVVSGESVNTAAIKQVLATFTADFVHDTYVHFCLAIGQRQIDNHLHNIKAIEELHAKYSKQKDGTQSDSTKPCVSSILTLCDTKDTSELVESLSSSDGGSSASEPDLVLGPTLALHGKTGLGRDSTNFGTSSWFVKMDEGSDPSAGTGGGAAIQTGSHSTVPVQTGTQTGQTSSGLTTTLKRNTRSNATVPDNREGIPIGMGGQGQSAGVAGGGDSQSATSLDRNSALFEAKFRPVEGSGTGNALLSDDE